MQLTVLGCSGTIESATSPCSGYLVEAQGYRVLLDVGNGVLASMQEHGSLTGIDAVVLSHLHGDHWLDLVPYTYAMHFHPDAQGKRTKLLGPANTLAAIASVIPDHNMSFVADVYEFEPLSSAPVRLGPFALSVAAASHSVPAYSVRLEHRERSLVYSGDTGESEELVLLANHADVLLCEAGFAGQQGDFPEGVHLTGEQAGRHAQLAQAQRLVVTHLMPWANPVSARDEARTTYTGPVLIASRGLVVEV